MRGSTFPRAGSPGSGARRRDANGDRIIGGQLFRRGLQSATDRRPVLGDVGLEQFGRLGFERGGALDRDDLAAVPVVGEMEGHSPVGTDVPDLSGVFLTS